MSTLKIIIKGEYFDQIKAGTKSIEFRDVTPFWTSRLYSKDGKKRAYEKIEFINGYNKDARRLITGFGGFSKKRGLYHIQVGKILSGKSNRTAATNTTKKAAREVNKSSDGDFYVQYHNADALGRFPFTKKTGTGLAKPDLSYRKPFSIYTSKKSVRDSMGGTCFLIVGITNNEKKYYLWTCFIIDKVESDEDLYLATGKGFNLRDSVLLNGMPGFKDFKHFCGNFGIGFQKINNHPFHKQLRTLANKYK